METCRIWNSWAIENWGLKFLNGKNSKCKDNEVGSLLLKAEEGNEFGWNVKGEFFFFFPFIFISWRLITSQHFNGFCHTLT